MPRGHEKEPGFKKLPDVPYRKGDMAPSMRDTDPSRGALQDVPRDPIYRVADFGAPLSASGGTESPASAHFTAGRPNTVRSQRETRVMPETQLPGSYNANSGNGAPLTSWMRKGGGPSVVEGGYRDGGASK